ncbi:MAG: metallophosphoesterase [Isosphaeraceae bacterium]
MKAKPRERDRPGEVASEGPCVAVENWLLTPEAGILHPGERTAVIADLHLGYEWARGAAGDSVPRHSLDEALRRLTGLLARSPVGRVVVAGDLVESARPCRRTAADVVRFGRWLDDREIQLVLIRGNHDGGLEWLMRRREVELPAGAAFQASLVVDGWTIMHGHDGATASRLIVGHHHPVLRAAGIAYPCFLAGPGAIMLPAFSRNAAGVDVTALAASAGQAVSSLRSLASTGSELLDFGPVGELASRLRGKPGQPGGKS